MMLADLGADVIKVEHPHRGDETRTWGPPFIAGESSYFLSINRNKRSLALDLKQEGDRKIARALIKTSDVLVHNFKLSDETKLGLSYQQVKDLNPEIVYANISAYGSSGPYAHKPGYDLLAQALTGFMSITGPAEGEGYRVGVAFIDVLAGLNAALGILASLYSRTTSGQSPKVESSLFETGVASLVNVASSFLLTKQEGKRHGNAHPSIVPYQQFACQDKPLVIAVANDGQFANLAKVLGQPQWLSDPRFHSNQQRVAHRDSLVPEIEAILMTRPRAAWLAILDQADVACAPVNQLSEVFAHPQIAAREMVQTVDHPLIPDLPQVSAGFKLAGQATPIYRAPPRLGEHSQEIIAELSDFL
jgi:crotonobetainyl-CoA:carnitine CoA-transferase CaiB-like acyl-CoA transferase